MKQIYGGKELLIKAKKQVKQQAKRKAKRQFRKQTKKLLGIPGTPPISSPGISTLESSK